MANCGQLEWRSGHTRRARVAALCGCAMWLFYVAILCGCAVWLCCVAAPCGCAVLRLRCASAALCFSCAVLRGCAVLWLRCALAVMCCTNVFEVHSERCPRLLAHLIDSYWHDATDGAVAVDVEASDLLKVIDGALVPEAERRRGGW